MLQVSDKTLSPFIRAALQLDLGRALAELGARQSARDRSKGCATLADARRTTASALEVCRDMRARILIELSGRNLAAIDAAIVRLGCGGGLCSPTASGHEDGHRVAWSETMPTIQISPFDPASASPERWAAVHGRYMLQWCLFPATVVRGIAILS